MNPEQVAAQALAALDEELRGLLTRRRALVAAAGGTLDPSFTVDPAALPGPTRAHEDLSAAVRVLSAPQPVAVRPAPPAGRHVIAVLGGNGGMGALFCPWFESLGHEVLRVGRTTAITAEQAAERADVVVVTVPILSTVEIIESVGPRMRPDALLCDFTSVKQEPLDAMLRSTRASVVGLHPMFGPGVRSFVGQRVVLCPGRGEAWQAWMHATLASAGFEITVTDAVRHDRAMALVQVLTHYQTQVLGLTLARMGVPLEEPLSFTSPAYLLELYVTARHFAQAADLYGPIEMKNPETAKVTATFRAAAAEVADILARADQPAFDGLFREVSGFFGQFTDEALAQSGFLIDRLVELTHRRSAPAQTAPEGDDV